MLDRVRSQGVVRCGAEQRPGVAAVAGDGRIAGLAVDLCRAVAIAVLGPQARVGFRLYGSSRDFDAVRDGADDLFFLTGAAIADQGLAPHVLPGPTVFIEQLAVMVPQASAARQPEDLAGATVCLMIGSDAERALDATAQRLHLSIARLGFEEDVEMLDAYNVQRCQAVVGEATALAVMRETGGVNHLASRILAPPLALAPVIAATGTTDGQWSALVAWVINALILADRRPSAWHASGAEALRRAAAVLGLQANWQRAVIREIGGYGDMLRRSLGDGSALRLRPGPNAPWPDGLLLPFGADD